MESVSTTGGALLTMTRTEAWRVPSASVALTRTMWKPSSGKVWRGAGSVDVVPSPKSQAKVGVALASARAAEKVTALPSSGSRSLTDTVRRVATTRTDTVAGADWLRRTGPRPWWR